jgi:NADH-quinone oxidoreductase subunit L
VPKWVKVSPFIAMLLGLGLAWLFYIRDTSLPKRLAQTFPGAYQFLLNKWYFDEIYEFLFVRPAKFAWPVLWKKGDGAVIDGGINGLAMGIVPFFTVWRDARNPASCIHYAFAMVLGIVVIVTFVTLTGGAN